MSDTVKYYRRIPHSTLYKVNGDGTVHRYTSFVNMRGTSIHSEWVRSKRTVECLEKWLERRRACRVSEEDLFLEFM